MYTGKQKIVNRSRARHVQYVWPLLKSKVNVGGVAASLCKAQLPRFFFQNKRIVLPNFEIDGQHLKVVI